MNIKLDENLPAGIAERLDALGHDVDTVPDEGLEGRPDTDILEAAVSAGRFLVTQDRGVSRLLVEATPGHPGALLVRLRHPGRTSLTRKVVEVLSRADSETWRGCVVVATEARVRVRRL